MTSKAGTKKVTRRRHSQEFRSEALALAEKIGISKAAKELGLQGIRRIKRTIAEVYTY